MWGVAAAWAGSFVISYLLREQERSPKDPPNVEKGSSTVAQEGAVLPIVLGRARVRKTNIVLYAGDESFRDYIAYSYYENDNATIRQYFMTAQLAICVRPLSNVNVRFNRVWAGDTRIFDRPPHGLTRVVEAYNTWGGLGLGGGVGSINVRGVEGGGLTVLDGRATQLETDGPGRDIVAAGPNRDSFLSTGNSYGGAPGICTAFLEEFQIGENQSVPGFSFEMSIIPDYTGTILSSVGGVLPTSLNAADANPAAALYMILTDNWIGLGVDPAKIDTASFNAAAVTLDAEENGFSMAFETASTGESVLREILKQIDGVLYIDPQTQQFMLTLVREDYVLASLPVFDDNEVLEVLDYKSTNEEDLYNQVRVEYEDRATSYGTRFAVNQNTSVAVASARIKSVDVKFPGVKTAALANALVGRELLFYTTSLALVSLRMTRAAISLRPGGVFKWTCAEYGISEMVLRVHNIRSGTLADGTIVVDASQDKYANVSGSFAPPPSRWVDNYGITPSAPPVIDSIEAPLGQWWEGLSNWTMVQAGDGHVINIAGRGADALPGSAGVEVSVDGGTTYRPAAPGTLVSPPAGSLGSSYLKTDTDPYYDQTTGLVVNGLSNTSPLRSYTQEEIRRGDNVVMVNDEIISFESVTDLGSGSYRLNNVWRGLFDTVASDHKADDKIVFLSGLDAERVSTKTQVKGYSDVRYRTVLTPDVKAKGQAPFAYSDLEVTRRAERAIRPTQFRLIDDGPDRVESGPERVKGATALAPATGVDTTQSTTDFGIVYTNDLRSSWARRSRQSAFDQGVTRGDDPDTEYSETEETRVVVEFTTPDMPAWDTLQELDLDDTNYIVGNTAFINLQSYPVGKGTLRLCACRNVKDAGLLSPRNAEEIQVDVASARQLLVNRFMVPYYDPNVLKAEYDPNSRDKVLPYGDDRIVARGWEVDEATRQTYFELDGLMQGSIPRYVAYPKSPINQVVEFPYFDTEGSQILVQAWVHKPSTGTGTAQIDIENYDSDLSLVDFDVNTNTLAAAGGRSGWTKMVATMPSMSAGAESMVLTLTSNWSVDFVGFRLLDAIMAPDFDNDVLTNGDFASLTGWTAGTGWSVKTSDGGLTPVDDADTNLASADGSLGDTNLSQAFDLTSGTGLKYNAGDYVRVQYFSGNTSAADQIGATLRAKTSGGTVLSTVTIDPAASPEVDEWYFHEMWMRIPHLADEIDIEFNAVAVAGTVSVDVCVSKVNMTLMKTAPVKTQFLWNQTTQQPQPLTPSKFAAATEDIRLRPSFIFPMDDGPGVAPVDVVQGATFDQTTGTEGVDFQRGAPAYGLFNGTDHVSVQALELSKNAGGVSASDLELGNPNGRSIGFYLQYNLVEGVTGTVNLLMKMGQLGALALGEMGYQLWYDQSTNEIKWTLEANTTETGYDTYTVAIAGVDDGCNHWVYCYIDVVGKEIGIVGDTAVVATADISATIEGLEDNFFFNSTDELTLGRNATVGGTYDDGPENPFQLTYMAILVDTYAESFTKAAGDRMWKHGRCPNLLTNGYEITYTRPSRVAYPIAAGKVAMWAGTGSGGALQVPLDFHEASGEIGLGNHYSVQNLVPAANDLASGYTLGGTATVNEAALVSERGRIEMDVVVGAANGDYASVNITGLTASTDYVFSVYHRSPSGSHTAEIAVTQQDLTTILSNATFTTLDTTCAREVVSFSTQIGQTQAQLRLYGGQTSTTESTGYHGVMLTEGLNYGPIVYNDVGQNGSLETLDDQTQYVVADTNEISTPDTSTVYARSAHRVHSVGQSRAVAVLAAAANLNDARLVRIQADGRLDSVTYDDVGATYVDGNNIASGNWTDDDVLERCVRFARKSNLAGAAGTIYDQLIVPTAISATSTGVANTSTSGHKRVYFACDPSGGQILAGPLFELSVYIGEVRDPAAT